MAVLSVKLTKTQEKRLDRAVRAKGFGSRSEFVRYALARAMEDELTVKELEDIVQSRREIAAGRGVALDELYPRTGRKR